MEREKSREIASEKNQVVLKALLHYLVGAYPKAQPTFVTDTVKYDLAHLSHEQSSLRFVDVDFLTCPSMPQLYESCLVNFSF